jgi:hypothetical protein
MVFLKIPSMNLSSERINLAVRRTSRRTSMINIGKRDSHPEMKWCPFFLPNTKKRFFHSGKYLNVIRECGKDVHYPWPEHENMFLNGFKLKSNQ